MAGRRRVAVVGGGWAGLAAAIEATRRGHRVALFEMAGQLGGRARDLRSGAAEGDGLDNGQHICIGAYRDTLDLLRTVGLTEAEAFLRLPLAIDYPEGPGLHLGRGPAAPAFALAVLRHPRWNLASKMALLRTAAAWTRNGFRCDPSWTVARLTEGLPAQLRDDFIEPLCVAALNTPADAASATVFLRVLRDALWGGRGAADLLLPRRSLGRLLPEPATRWLADAGATVHQGRRIRSLTRQPAGWNVEDEGFDAVVLATPATESARLVAGVDPAWANTAADLVYEPIVTVYLRSAGTSLPAPMLALRASARAPAQFVFDRGQLGGPPGLLAFVVSGARTWSDAGIDVTAAACRTQAREALRPWLKTDPAVVQTVVEKRATFRCTPALQRPPTAIAPGLVAAGDYVEGPYPATLEGAVRSGLAAARAIAT